MPPGRLGGLPRAPPDLADRPFLDDGEGLLAVLPDTGPISGVHGASGDLAGLEVVELLAECLQLRCGCAGDDAVDQSIPLLAGKQLLFQPGLLGLELNLL